MSKFISFFIRDHIPEDKVVALFNKAIPEGVESLDFPKAPSAIFLQYLEHDAEFQRSAGLSWASDELQIDEISLANKIAETFSTDVLLEPQALDLPKGYNWCLVTPDRRLYAVNTVDVDDGIALRQGSTRLRIER
ncbi:hypothetical protein [Pseudomonas sp. GD03944]|uniref:hypothetical protein n=1 Tax=Pseudomonas sp. GD03944 TaxID=2975409 RepID=UPI002447402B|nr:hypothetical protein [Pseudomonas sp. GD03944]MDH1263068.1 hypothetical protein [Pseudomonas sp. GD03944]